METINELNEINDVSKKNSNEQFDIISLFKGKNGKSLKKIIDSKIKTSKLLLKYQQEEGIEKEYETIDESKLKDESNVNFRNKVLVQSFEIKDKQNQIINMKRKFNPYSRSYDINEINKEDEILKEENLNINNTVSRESMYNFNNSKKNFLEQAENKSIMSFYKMDEVMERTRLKSPYLTEYLSGFRRITLDDSQKNIEENKQIQRELEIMQKSAIIFKRSKNNKNDKKQKNFKDNVRISTTSSNMITRNDIFDVKRKNLNDSKKYEDDDGLIFDKINDKKLLDAKDNTERDEIIKSITNKSQEKSQKQKNSTSKIKINNSKLSSKKIGKDTINTKKSSKNIKENKNKIKEKFEKIETKTTENDKDIINSKNINDANNELYNPIDNTNVISSIDRDINKERSNLNTIEENNLDKKIQLNKNESKPEIKKNSSNKKIISTTLTKNEDKKISTKKSSQAVNQKIKVTAAKDKLTVPVVRDENKKLSSNNHLLNLVRQDNKKISNKDLVNILDSKSNRSKYSLSQLKSNIFNETHEKQKSVNSNNEILTLKDNISNNTNSNFTNSSKLENQKIPIFKLNLNNLVKGSPKKSSNTGRSTNLKGILFPKTNNSEVVSNKSLRLSDNSLADISTHTEKNVLVSNRLLDEIPSELSPRKIEKTNEVIAKEIKKRLSIILPEKIDFKAYYESKKIKEKEQLKQIDKSKAIEQTRKTENRLAITSTEDLLNEIIKNNESKKSMLSGDYAKIKKEDLDQEAALIIKNDKVHLLHKSLDYNLLIKNNVINKQHKQMIDMFMKRGIKDKEVVSQILELIRQQDEIKRRQLENKIKFNNLRKKENNKTKVAKKEAPNSPLKKYKFNIPNDDDYNVDPKLQEQLKKKRDQIIMVDMNININFLLAQSQSDEEKRRYQDLVEKMNSLKNYDADKFVKNIEDFYRDFKSEETEINQILRKEERMNQFFTHLNTLRQKKKNAHELLSNVFTFKDAHKHLFKTGPLISEP